MDPLHAVVLGIIQGLTEFVAVSSSGHLVVVPAFLGWPAQSLAFDAVLHFGTLFAVLAYFRENWGRVARGWLQSVSRRRATSPDERLAWFVVLGSGPAGAAGLFLGKWFEAAFASPRVAGYLLLATAGALVVAEALGRKERDLAKLRLPDVLAVGLAQAVAILPGISRSGATISSGLLLGLTRLAATRFSFLLAAPVTFGVGVTQLPSALAARYAGSDLLPLALGFVSAAVIGYLCIDFLLRYLRLRSLYPFAGYCAALGLAVAFALTPG